VHDQSPTLSAHINSEVQHINRGSFGHKHKPLLLLAVCVSFEQPAGWHMLQLTPSGVRALSSSCRSLSLLRSRSSLLSRSGEGPTRHQSVPSVVYHYLSNTSNGMQQCCNTISAADRLQCWYIPSLQQGLIDQTKSTNKQKQHNNVSPPPITCLAVAQTHR